MKPLGELKVGDWFLYGGSLCMVASTKPPTGVKCLLYTRGLYSQIVILHQDDDVEYISQNPACIFGVEAA